jgi:FdhD protein
VRLTHASPVAHVDATRAEGTTRTRTWEAIAEETPVTLAYNGAAHAVMMATPADLEDFAVGFSRTEGMISRVDELSRVSVVRYSRGIELQLETSAEIAARAGTRSRRLSGRTGCGICGMEDVDAVLRELPRVSAPLVVTRVAVSRAVRELTTRQPINDETGAVHAAGWAHPDGTVELVREDVGRHNALDKLAGALLRAGMDASTGFIVLTSRGSFELVQKAAVIGVALVATVSAPTALAVRVAVGAGVSLIGFARDDRLTIYCGEDRLTG